MLSKQRTFMNTTSLPSDCGAFPKENIPHVLQKRCCSFFVLKRYSLRSFRPEMRLKLLVGANANRLARGAQMEQLHEIALFKSSSTSNLTFLQWHPPE